MTLATHYLEEIRRQMHGYKRLADSALAQISEEEFFRELDPESQCERGFRDLHISDLRDVGYRTRHIQRVHAHVWRLPPWAHQHGVRVRSRAQAR